MCERSRGCKYLGVIVAPGSNATATALRRFNGVCQRIPRPGGELTDRLRREARLPSAMQFPWPAGTRVRTVVARRMGTRAPALDPAGSSRLRCRLHRELGAATPAQALAGC